MSGKIYILVLFIHVSKMNTSKVHIYFDEKNFNISLI